VRGTDFIEALVAASGVRIASASRQIGHSDKGGVWTLDFAARPPITDSAVQAYQGVLDSTNATTVDNLNVLDAIKSNDTSGVEYIYWSDVAAFLTTSTNATQTVTIQQEFQAGQLLLTFQSGSSYYTIGHGAAGYYIEITDQYGAAVGQVDPYTGSQVTSSASLPAALTNPIANLSSFVSALNSFFQPSTALVTQSIDGGAGKDNIQGIASNANIHNIIEGGGGADVLTGGIGSDYFVFAKATDSPAAGQLNPGGQLAQTWDQITNFQVGTDKIDFSQLITDQSVALAQRAFSAGLTEFRWFGAQPANTNSMGAQNASAWSVTEADTVIELWSLRLAKFVNPAEPSVTVPEAISPAVRLWVAVWVPSLSVIVPEATSLSIPFSVTDTLPVFTRPAPSLIARLLSASAVVSTFADTLELILRLPDVSSAFAVKLC
jgi:hypothetical protein